MKKKRLLAIAQAIKAEAGVTRHHVLIEPKRSNGHVALRHDHRKPRWRREYEAEMWAHDALRRHGVAVPEDDTINAMMDVYFAIEDADERGRFGQPKRIATEAASWSGWARVDRLP
jgi:hypothetical protein